MKKMMKIAGARQLSKNEQKNVVGGMTCCTPGGCCDPILECCAPNVGDGGGRTCQTDYPNCSYLYQYEFVSCCPGCGNPPVCA